MIFVFVSKMYLVYAFLCVSCYWGRKASGMKKSIFHEGNATSLALFIFTNYVT